LAQDFEATMNITRSLAALVTIALLAPEAAFAANKEHQQLMAEIRMLQEQQQQLQQVLGGLADTLKTMTSKMDAQTNMMQKAFADQNLVVNNIGETVRTLREKADETNVRISTMTQEIQALRQTVASIPQSAPAPAPATVDPATGQPMAPPPSASTNPPPTNVSPTRMFDQAYADYSAGQFDLAVEGFQAFIRTFPTSPNADDAQFYIGQSLYQAGKYNDAVAALQKVTTDYPQTDSVPKALYKIGQAYEALKQPEPARKAYEAVIKNHPGAFEAVLAKQRLDLLAKTKG
jgi:tol-pal system protein YbgF